MTLRGEGLLLPLLLLALVAPAPAYADAAADLARALHQERDGDPRQAVATLDEIVRRSPNGGLADDALLHSGRILEERLGRPAEALVRYRELVDQFPRSRLARRASARIALLAPQLPAGEQAVAELEAILAMPDAQLAQGARRMEKLLSGPPVPPLALRERGRLWLGGAYARLGLPGRALAEWEAIARESRGRPAASRALRAIGAERVRSGRPDEAERAYRRLARLPGGRAAAASGLRAVRRARLMQDAVQGAAAGIALIVVVLAVIVVRRAGWRALAPSTEIAFLAPVFAVCVLLGALAWARADPSAANAWQLAVGMRAVAWIAVGGLTFAHVGGAFARVVRGVETRRWIRIVLPVGLALASLSFVALVLEVSGLGPFVWETLRAGTEP